MEKLQKRFDRLLGVWPLQELEEEVEEGPLYEADVKKVLWQLSELCWPMDKLPSYFQKEGHKKNVVELKVVI